MTCGYIYKIQFPNGKHYIGQTISLEQRQYQHRWHAKNGGTKYLYNALRKYKMEDTVELIEIDTAETQEELCEKEIQYIQEYNSYYLNKNGYNMTFGGEGLNGYVYTEEDNRKNSERIKKHYEDNPEARQKCSERMKKQFENPEARQKSSEAQTKRYKENPEAAKEHGERVKEYYENNPEARQKISETTKKRFESPEARQQASERTKNHYENNPEARKQMSEIKKIYYEKNPEARQKSLDTQGKNKPFDIFTIDGTFVKTFCYQFEAREYLQKEYHIISIIKISEVLSGCLKRSAGFVFKYK